MNLQKPENADDAGQYLNGTIAGGGLHATLDTLDAAVLLTAAQTLANKTLVTPTIASFVNAQHDHANAVGGGALGAGVTLNNPVINNPSYIGAATTGQTYDTAGQVTLNVYGAAGASLRLRDRGAAVDNEIWELGTLGGQLSIGAVNDAITINNPAVRFDRTGTTPTVTNFFTPSLSALVTNANLELGNKVAANTPFIDFNSSGSNNDFDARLMASGGGSVGTGNMLLQAGSLAVTPFGSPQATSGIIRIANNQFLTARNVANTGDVIVCGIDGSDRLVTGAAVTALVGASGGAAVPPAQPAFYLRWMVQGSEFRVPLYLS